MFRSDLGGPALRGWSLWLPLTPTLSPRRAGRGSRCYDAVFITNGLPPPGPLLIHTDLD
jgi:hypothetical protein